MDKIDLGSVSVRCPKCSSTQISKGDTPDTDDVGTCSGCGERFSLKDEIRKIGNAATKALAEAIRKTFK